MLSAGIMQASVFVQVQVSLRSFGQMFALAVGKHNFSELAHLWRTCGPPALVQSKEKCVLHRGKRQDLMLVLLVLQAQECENLMRVVRELTASRSKLVAGKSVMAERFAELQQEYIKVLRIAELSRAASRSNLAKADRATNLAKQARLCSNVLNF